MKRSWKKRYSIFPFIFLFTLVLHLGLLALKFYSRPPDDDQSPLVVKLVDESVKFKKQIVQSEDSENDEARDDAFLSDQNRSFDRETMARKNDIFRQGEKGGGGPKPRKKIDLNALGEDVAKDPFKLAAEEYTKKKNGHSDKGPSAEVSSTNDYVEDVSLGDMTNLNTVEYKYYGFYHRIRQKLEQFWGRSIHETANQLLEQGRRIASSEALITALEITLDHNGEIVRIRIMGTSGIKELDDAAVESFNKAGPFPNPPKGLIVNGKVTLEWGFVVKS